MSQTIIQTPTNSLSLSHDFYTHLAFQKEEGYENVFTDGKVLLEINADRKARAGIKMFKSSWQEEIKKLKDLTGITESGAGYLMNDNGVWIYLVESASPYEFTPSKESFSVLGNYMGLSLESGDLKRSVEVYEILGFNIVAGGLDQPYVTMANQDDFGIFLMRPLQCPHLFFNPSMTYFNGQKNLAIIEEIRELNIPIAEEITYFNSEGTVDNIIIRDPGGYGFFIFND